MRTYAPFSCNPFRIRTYKKQAGGGGASSGSGARHSPFVARRNTQVLSFHTLAHSFALTKNSTLFFSSAPALFAKNHPGWGEECVGPACISLVFWDSAVKRGPIVSHLFRLFQLSTVDRRSRPCRDCQPLLEPPPLPPQTGVLEFQ